MTIEAENRAEKRDEDFYETMRWVDINLMNYWNSRVEKYFTENLYLQKHIKKVDPKELLLSKLKKE